MGTALGEILATLAIAVLKYFMGRKDLTDAVKGRIATSVLELAVAANEWKADAATRPDGGATLKLRDDAGAIELSSETSRANK